ncbi:MAG: class I fructose-bisphosphate aldolase [Planctomycetota bacterium]
MSFRKPRLNRLFARTGKCFDVAIDHGFFNEASFLGGIEDLERAVRTIAEAGPDAIQLTVGQARLLQDLPGPRKPALVLRTDVANVYPPALPHVLWSKMIDDPVEQALQLDAACVVVNLLLVPGQPDLHGQCVENVCRLKPACERYGMPLMVEPLVMQPNEKSGGYMVDGDLRKIMALVRQAVELGADVIKADPCDDVREYHKVVEVAGRVPVLVRGGGKAPTAEILRRTYDLMQQGARGIVYGRNVIQHPDPAGITRAFMAIVHEGATPEQAARFVKE